MAVSPGCTGEDQRHLLSEIALPRRDTGQRRGAAALALLALNIDPAPAWLAIAGLFAVTAALIVIAAIRARRMEISYAAD